MNSKKVNCDICGAAEYDLLFQGKDRLHHLPGCFPVVVCRNCDLIYLNPRPDDDTLLQYYPEEYSPFANGRGLIDRLQTLLRKLEARHVRRQLPKGGRVLEIGCATGDLLVPLRDEQGFLVAGVEMSSYAASLARKKYGLEVFTGTVFDAPFGDESFDAVIMRHVIEHFPSARQALEKTGRLLKKKGTLFITTPNFDSIDRRVFGHFWYDYDTPRHLAVFSVHTLNRLLESTGFEIVEIRHSLMPNDWIHSVRYFLEEHFGHRRFLKFFSIKNPLLLLLFLPFGLVQKALKKSGRIEVVAIKRS